MPIEFITLIAVMAMVITLFVTQWIPVEMTVLLTVAILPMTGLLSPSEAFSGFASPATVTIACMFVLSAGLTHTSALDFLKDLLAKHSKGSPTRLILLLALFVPPASAFINNTPVVVMLVPIVINLAREMDAKPSKLLIPLSYLAILGGTCTLIGTNTNIVVNQLYREATGASFGMFDFTPLGITYLAGGLIFLMTVGQRLLPSRTSLAAMLTQESTSKFVTEITIPANSKLLDQRVAELFATRKGIRLLEMIRDEEVYMAVETRELSFRAGDSLLVEGPTKKLSAFLADCDVQLAERVADESHITYHSTEVMLSEAVVLPASRFVGQTLGDLCLNRRYGVKVLGIMRSGQHHRRDIRGLLLRPGDVLLVQADREGFLRLRETEAVMIAHESTRTLVSTRHRKIALATIIGVVVAASNPWLPVELSVAAIIGVVVLILTRTINLGEALSSIDTNVVFILAGTIPLGLAMQETGLASATVAQMVPMLENLNPVALLSLFYLATALVTQLMSNQACAVLLTPVAFSLASALNVHPEPLLVAICFGASASFMTPLGYATNTIVMGPGGYTFMDYVRIGLPLNLITWLLATVLIPVFWPLS